MKKNRSNRLGDFRAMVDRFMSNRSTRVLQFESVAHSVITQSEILDKARINGLPVDVYCSSLSIYQDHTKSEIEKLIPALKKAPDSEHPYSCLVKSLSDFFQSGGRMNVVLDTPLKGVSRQKIWKCLQKPLINGQLNIRLLPKSVGLGHFTVAGNMYCRERSNPMMNTVCSINPTRAAVLKDVFKSLVSNSVRIDIS